MPNGFELLQQLCIGAMQRHFHPQCVGQLDLYVLQRLNAGDSKLRCGIFFTTKRAAHQHGHVDAKLFGELFVVLREGD